MWKPVPFPRGGLFAWLPHPAADQTHTASGRIPTICGWKTQPPGHPSCFARSKLQWEPSPDSHPSSRPQKSQKAQDTGQRANRKNPVPFVPLVAPSSQLNSHALLLRRAGDGSCIASALRLAGLAPRGGTHHAGKQCGLRRKQNRQAGSEKSGSKLPNSRSPPILKTANDLTPSTTIPMK